MGRVVYKDSKYSDKQLLAIRVFDKSFQQFARMQNAKIKIQNYNSKIKNSKSRNR